MKDFPHIKRKILSTFAATVVIACFYSIAPAQVKHPPTFIEKGACPFEFCTYNRLNTHGVGVHQSPVGNCTALFTPGMPDTRVAMVSSQPSQVFQSAS